MEYNFYCAQSLTMTLPHCTGQCDDCHKRYPLQDTPSLPKQEVVCPACGGDGKETCNNPDHGFIEAMPGETGRLGCPVCGHDPNHKVNRGRNTCLECGGHGHVSEEVAEEFARLTGYDDEFAPYVEPSPKQEPENDQKINNQ